ncbi:MAG: DNA recombination protein RmuC [Thermoleophilia bacterium]
MTDIVVILSLIFSAAALVLLVMVLKRLTAGDGDELAQSISREFRMDREESARAARELREEVARTQKDSTDTIVRTMSQMGRSQQEQLQGVTAGIKQLSDSNVEQLEKSRFAIDGQLKTLQEGNEKKLDEMRKTVDEKLHDTLEKRLGESFKLVSERLEAVQRGLGEMQNLATGVGDLKRVLTNVKSRGTWGEVQLGAILEQILTPDQFACNVQTHETSQERVEYAIKLPGRGDRQDSTVWLPIDAKFPQEDYERLLTASEHADGEAEKLARDALLRAVEKSARDIQDKYLNPPKTTDFAILFLPTEGLYAEVLRQPGLVDKMQQSYRVVIAGPTTLSAILNSLRMGFRTLAIEQRSSEVWQVLAAVKTEFGKFGDVLAKVKKQLHTAEKSIGETETRTRVMERKLRDVEQLPSDSAADLLELSVLELDDEIAAEGSEIMG